jgi:hypothetical protein
MGVGAGCAGMVARGGEVTYESGIDWARSVS